MVSRLPSQDGPIRDRDTKLDRALPECAPRVLAADNAKTSSVRTRAVHSGDPFLDPTLEPFTVDAPVSTDEFARILRRERSRCDRLGDSFTTVTIRAVGPDPIPVATILTALEPCEDIGWLDRRTLAILMPHTGGDQAIREIRRRFSSLTLDDNVEIERRTYPTPGDHPAAAKGRSTARRAFSAVLQRRRRAGFAIPAAPPRQAGASGTLFSLISAIASLIFGR